MIPGSGRSPEKKMATHSSTLPGKFHGWALRACLEVLAGQRSYSYTLDRRPGPPLSGMVVLFDRARSFGRDAHGAVREEGDTCLASQMSRINPGDQWGDMSQPDRPHIQFHGWRSLVGYSPWVAKSRTQLSNFTFTLYIHENMLVYMSLCACGSMKFQMTGFLVRKW